MSGSEKQSETSGWSTHDPACNHCRVRKIRCGREHPQCTNCIRIGAQCDFTDHGKRINHMKLLVNNVNGLEDRLVRIEKEISRLTKTLRNGLPGYPTSASSDSGSPRPSQLGMEWIENWQTPHLESTIQQAPIRHVLRHQVDGSDRYYGPCTLAGLCNSFRESVSSLHGTIAQGNQDSATDENLCTRTHDALWNLCVLAGTEEPLNVDHDNPQIFLPPKQFLLMACTSFFQQENPSIDIFCQPSFWSNVERIYNKPLTRADEAWALCYNAIILLVLGLEPPENAANTESLIGSQFSFPFISTIRCAVAGSRILMAPRLVNVQALTLLSVTAQQYLEPCFADVVLEQACMLAKRMGLHHKRCHESGDEADADLERVKVFRALYLRDKTLSLSRGTSPILPSCDCNVDFTQGDGSPNDRFMRARIHLAKLQEDIYRDVYSAESSCQATGQRKSAISTLQKRFAQWVETYGSDLDEILPRDLELEFHASRVLALRLSSELKHKRQVIHDSRICCRLLILQSHEASKTKLDASVMQSPSKSGSEPQTGSHQTTAKKVMEQGEIQIRGLLEILFVPAFFALIQNILWPILAENLHSDLELVEQVNQILLELDDGNQANNGTRKVSAVLNGILTIVKSFKPELAPLQEASTQDKRPLSSQNAGNQRFQVVPSIIPGLSLFSSHNTSEYSTSNTTRSNSPPFDLLQPFEFIGRGDGYDPNQPIEHFNKRKCLSISSDEYVPENMFTYFPDMLTVLPPNDDQQETANHAGFEDSDLR